MTRSRFEQHVVDAVRHDAETAVKFDGARAWLRSALEPPMEPLAAEVWVFDRSLARVVLVRHR